MGRRHALFALSVGTGLLMLGVTGCQAPAASGGAATPVPVEPTELTVRVRTGPADQARTWRLTCDPAGGDHPNPQDACRALTEAGPEVLAPPPADQICTQVFGGQQTATIRGRWHGEPVSTTVTRRNGCEIARWDALVGLLPAP